ncbi:MULTISPECIES: hypothetical protein [Agrobacterium]|jgi:hypothetical protein|uniref:hypothetical protein n=1 Tax=Agrobacterium tumefaciens TaxID=358 RepID=UPI0015741213|nr:hypothetical protein [Agrobacterium tumefaciens]
MLKTVKLKLKDFPNIPGSLLDSGSYGGTPSALSEIPVNLNDLFRFYYLQSYDLWVSGHFAFLFEHVRHLEPITAFTFSKNGLGAHKTKKQNNSNDLGEAFCRWFLSTHLNIHHVARMDDVCGHGAITAAVGWSVKRSSQGDAPDYFCVDQRGLVTLAEAKGTMDSLTFKNAKFVKWRQQFDRVTIRDPAGHAVYVKGYIVAMRWKILPKHGNRIDTTLFAEDPNSPGERPLDDNGMPHFSAAVRSLHYAPSLARLGQPLLSAALAAGTAMDRKEVIRATVWKSVRPELSGLRFVGGCFYYAEEGFATSPLNLSHMAALDLLRRRRKMQPILLPSIGHFFGIEEKTFYRLVAAGKEGPLEINKLPELERRTIDEGGVGLLPDGHVFGPYEAFEPVEDIEV